MKLAPFLFPLAFGTLSPMQKLNVVGALANTLEVSMDDPNVLEAAKLLVRLHRPRPTATNRIGRRGLRAHRG